MKVSPCRSRTIASHQPYSRASWAMTRWQAPLSSQDRGRPRAAGRLSLSPVLLSVACGSCPRTTTRSLYSDLPDIRHKPSAVGVKPTQRQFLGVLGYVFRTGFIDLEPHRVGGLGYEVRLGIDEPRTPRFLLLVEAKDDQGRR